MKNLIASLLSLSPRADAPTFLILQLNRIGELVLTTPAIKAIRERWPGARITLALSETNEGLVPSLPKVEETIVFKKSLHADRRFYRRILTGSYDVCLDFTGNDRSTLLSIGSRARRRITFASDKGKTLRRFFYENVAQIPTSEDHVIDRFFSLVGPLGVPTPTEPPSPVLEVPQISRNRISRLLKECGVPEGFVLLQPGSAGLEKYWLPERWAELILELQNRHRLPCVLTGGPDPYEQDHLRSIRTAIAMIGQGPVAEPLVTLAGQLDLTLLTALVEKASVVVSCDTSVSHMAWAFRRPQVTLFGPTNPFLWRPRHEASLVISAEHPEKIADSFDPNAPGAPMFKIPTATVLKACEKLIAAFPPNSRHPDKPDSLPL